MSSLTTLPALLAFLEQARIVFSTCPGSPSAVTIGTDVTSILYQAYYQCSTIISLVIASTITSFGIYHFNNTYRLLVKNKNVNKYIITIKKIIIIKQPKNIIFLFNNNNNILILFSLKLKYL